MLIYYLIFAVNLDVLYQNITFAVQLATCRNEKWNWSTISNSYNQL